MTHLDECSGDRLCCSAFPEQAVTRIPERWPVARLAMPPASRAKHQRAIRPANLRQTLFNLYGLVLLYPAVAEEHHAGAGPDPFSAKARRARKDELRLLLLGALAPR